MKVLPNSFFQQKTLRVARALVGKTLVRKVGKQTMREMIVETEAYVGPQDLASHSARGKTLRNEIMYKEAGTIYTYFTYGMHWMLNIVTEKKNFPTAVLVRGTENITGPGRLTKALKIDRSLNGKKLGRPSGLWIEDTENEVGKNYKIIRTPRIGIASAGEIWAGKPYRFVLVEKKLKSSSNRNHRPNT